MFNYIKDKSIAAYKYTKDKVESGFSYLQDKESKMEKIL